MLKIDPQGEKMFATLVELDKFEKDNNFCFSSEHRRFLHEVTNGGFIFLPMAIPTIGCFGGAGDLHGIYGIYHPNADYDMQRVLTDIVNLLPDLVPFGFDQGLGQLFIDMSEKAGRMVYVPWDEMGNVPLVTYHVADSIDEFLQESAKLTAKLAEEGI